MRPPSPVIRAKDKGYGSATGPRVGTSLLDHTFAALVPLLLP